MKFAEHLSAHITPEWRKQYISYEEMKNMLYNAMERQPSVEVVDKDEIIRYNKAFDEEFFSFCEKELAKINTFYAEKLAEATRRFSSLKSEFELSKSKLMSATSETSPRGGSRDETRPLKSLLDPINPLNVVAANREARKNSRKMHEIKLGFSEFYLSLVLLQNYQNLNFTGFRKILKKHDKLLENDMGSKWRQSRVETSLFYTNKDIGKLIEETESVVTNELEEGDRQKAMKRLRVPPLNDKQSPWTTYKVGFFTGAFAVLIFVVILTALYRETNDDWRIVFRLYRGPFLIILFLFLIGINVYGWRTSGVNHVLIFELDPRDHLSEQDLIEIASIFSVMWSISVIFYLYSNSLGIPAFVNPLALVVIMILFLINPTPTLCHNARFWLLRVLTRIVAAPFVKVNFADFWLADQLNSLVPVFGDSQYFICFYITASYESQNVASHNNLTSTITRPSTATVGTTTTTTIANFSDIIIDEFPKGMWYENHDAERCVSSAPGLLVLRAIVACLPAWFRFAQCLRRYYDDNRGPFPHLVNALKYATTFFVVIFSTLTRTTTVDYENSYENPYFICWIISMIVSSCYTYIWDIKMDWGLFDTSASTEYAFLREEIVYSSPLYYYFAIVEDLVLRFGWTLSVSLTEIGLVHVDLMQSILSPLEVFRRFVWNFFRLENEHLNNCGEFRAVRDISIAPVDTGDQAKLIKMMDDPDGVINRRRKTTTTTGAQIQTRFRNKPDRTELRLLISDGAL